MTWHVSMRSKCSQTHNLLMMMVIRCTTNDKMWKMSTEITDIWPRKKERTDLHTDNKPSSSSFRWLSYEFYRIYSIFIIFSMQFRSTNSIRSVHCASLMVIIFFSRVSRLPLDCVGYQSSKAKWSIFSLFLYFAISFSIL